MRTHQHATANAAAQAHLMRLCTVLQTLFELRAHLAAMDDCDLKSTASEINERLIQKAEGHARFALTHTTTLSDNQPH